MSRGPLPTFAAFAGQERLALGDLLTVAEAGRRRVEARPDSPVLVFEEATGRLVDLDLRGTASEVLARVTSSPTSADSQRADRAPRGRGRPKLGVVSKEVTLLPRHWAWLSAQRGTASAVLRRLVDEARRTDERREVVRRAQDATYRFMTSMAGDSPGYESAIRALYRSDGGEFAAATSEWPADVRSQCARMAAEAFERT
ncbi:MAG: DUF2239 family protein [Gemmatimonadetes bacterium]|nr:DUF2239 family protein [Gemmatimonadota bacterium]